MVTDFQKAAERGDRTAMKLLGDMYYQGPSGSEGNVAAALPWWQKAAEHGERALAKKVGYAYFTGDGCEKDEKKALYYYHMAADYTDDADAAYTVGLLHENGFGCHKNIKKAIPYYEKAACKGHAEAQWRLGMLLFTSRKSDGLHWICCAHLSGIQEATDALNHFISNGSSAEAIHHEIALIQKHGIEYDTSSHAYYEEWNILLSVLKWGTIGLFVGLLFVVIVCGYMLQMEHFPNLILLLIIGLFGYIGYWWETN